jgi:type IV secretory pathway TraG/TraD family ATPase VirD4
LAQKKNDKGQDLTMAYVACALGIAGAINKLWPKIMKYYFDHYEFIYLFLWGVVLLLIGLFIRFIMKKTAHIKRRGELLKPFWNDGLSKIFVGTTDDDVRLHLTDERRCTHVQIIGTTGRGKTQSVVIPWVLYDLERNKASVLIDGKGSPEVPITIKKAIERYGLKSEVFTFDLDEPENSVRINPIKEGSAQQITDRIFSAFNFDDSFYKSVQYDICGYLIRLTLETKTIPTLKLLYFYLTDDKVLADKLKELDDKSLTKKALIEFLKTPTNERKKNMAGLISQLSPFAVGEVSAFVNGGENEITLSQVLNSKKGNLLVMSISTLKYQEIGHQLGKLVLQELAYVVGERERSPAIEFSSVFLDEFSEFVYDGFVRILNKARSAKVAMHISHQSMSDLSAVSPDFAKAINTNTNIKCILGINDPDTADFYAKHLGTQTTRKLTEQVEESGFFSRMEEVGRGSSREVEEYRVHPNDLKELFNGRGVLHIPTAKGPITEIIQFNRIKV